MTSSPSAEGAADSPRRPVDPEETPPIRPPDPHDVRLVPIALATWIAVGLGLGADATITTHLALLAACLAVLSLVGALHVPAARGARRGRRAPGGRRVSGGRLTRGTARGLSRRAAPLLLQCALVLGGTAGGLCVTALHHANRSDQPLHELAATGSAVVVEGIVLTDPRPSIRGLVRVTLDLTGAAPASPASPAAPAAPADQLVSGASTRQPLTGASGQAVVLVQPPDQRIRIGSTLQVTGTAQATMPADAAIAVVHAGGPAMLVAPTSGVLGAVDQLREGLRAATSDLSPQAQGLVPGVALGDDRALPADLADAAKVTGLTHLTAVSGAHVSLVLVGVLGVVGRGRPRTAALVAPVVVLALVVLVRPEPSVLRAGATGAVVLLAALLGRPARALPALAAAVVALLLVDPPLARSYGLVLSAGATAAIIVLSGPIARILSHGVPRWLARGLAIPAAAQLACAPVLVLLDPRLALTAVPANVLAAPAVPGATMLGLGAALAHPVSPLLAEWLARAASWHTAWIAWVARTLAAAPSATVPWPDGARGLLLLAATTVVACLALGRLLTTGPRVRVLVLLTFVPGAIAVVPAEPGAGSPDGWLVMQCDVGQASAVLLRTGPGTAVIVDVGDADGAAAMCVRETGLERLDAVVLTHDHADHTAGLPALLGQVEVGEVLVPAVDGPSPGPRATEELTESGSVARVREIVAGEQLEWRQVTAEVLLPRPGARASADSSSSVNESSVALLVTLPGPDGPVRVLVAGDLEAAGQARLTRALADRAVTYVDVVVVPHHGSGNLDPALARRTSPALALVSAGLDNDHGHPAPRALEVWTGVGARVARTDECGHMWVAPRDGGRLALVGCG